MNNYLGIDIGGTRVKLGIITENGEIITETDTSVDFDGYETPIIDTVTDTVIKFLDEISPEIKKDIKGIGVSATGQIDKETGKVIGTAGHIKNYLGTDIKGRLESATGLKAACLNDANAALLGEVWQGRAKDCQDVVMMTIGTGVGGGILSGGHLIEGAHGIAGEIGHMTIDRNGEDCTCNNRGCLEKYASTKALVKRVNESEAAELFLKENKRINGKAIFDYLKADPCDEKLREVVSDWQDDIVSGLITLIHIFEPSLVLLGGGVSEAGDVFIEPIREKVKSRAMTAFINDLKIDTALLGNAAGMLGAVYYFKSKCE